MGQPGASFDEDFIGQAPSRPKVRTRHQKKMLRAGGQGPVTPFVHVGLEADVRVRVTVYPTEDRRKVEAGVLALFPDAELAESPEGRGVAWRARDLRRFAEVVRNSRIRDAAREFLFDHQDADGWVRFKLNKQAACAARVNFQVQPAVLGAIEVELLAGDPSALIEEMTWIEGESDERLFGTKLHTLPPDRRRRR